MASYKGHVTVVELFTERDSTALKVKNADGDTALHLAASGGYLEVVEKLLETDSELVNAQNSKGRTPLHEAAESSCKSVIKILMGVPHVEHTIQDSVSLSYML